jgi:hypothetical protein
MRLALVNGDPITGEAKEERVELAASEIRAELEEEYCKCYKNQQMWLSATHYYRVFDGIPFDKDLCRVDICETALNEAETDEERAEIATNLELNLVDAQQATGLFAGVAMLEEFNIEHETGPDSLCYKLLIDGGCLLVPFTAVYSTPICDWSDAE